MNDVTPPSTPPADPGPHGTGPAPSNPGAFDYGALTPAGSQDPVWQTNPVPPGAGMPPASGSYPPYGAGMPGAPQVPPTSSQHPSVSIRDFQEPKGKRWWIIGLCLVLAALVTIAIAWFSGGGKTTPAPTPTPTLNPTSRPTPRGPQDELAWESNSAKGTWRVTSTQWEGTSVTLGLEMTCSEGVQRFRLMGYTNDTSRQLNPVPAKRQPDLKTGTLRSGDKLTGFVTFEMARGDGTVYLTDPLDSAISARSFKK